MTQEIKESRISNNTKSSRGSRTTGKKTMHREDSNWDQRLGFLMHDVARLRRIAFNNFVKPLGLTRSQWWVLAHLSRHDGMIQSDLADILELGKAALGGLIDRLESSAYIERRHDDNDRRVKRIYLTSKGNHVIKEMRELNHQMNEEVLKDLDEEQRHSLAEMLNVVKENLLKIKHDNSIDA